MWSPWQAVAPVTSSRIFTAPTAEPLSLDFCKSHLRVVDYADDDGLIDFYGKMAREYTEGFLGWAMMPQTWDQWWDDFPAWSQPLELARQPVTSVTSLAYTDYTGTTTTLTPTTDYVFDGNSDPPRIVPAFGKFWPAVALAPVAAVKARFPAGYADAASVPFQLKEMILVLLGHWYQNRSDVEIDNRLRALEIPRQFNDLAAKFSPPLMA